jgi:hypothetical protein
MRFGRIGAEPLALRNGGKTLLSSARKPTRPSPNIWVGTRALTAGYSAVWTTARKDSAFVERHRRHAMSYQQRSRTFVKICARPATIIMTGWAVWSFLMWFLAAP